MLLQSDRSGLWLWTHSGRPFWPTDPREEDVCLEDIVHALSCQNRFGGHSREPYSVAQHCVLVSELCDPHDAMEGLFHDAAEAYVVDVPRPLKYSVGMEGYKPIEEAVHRVIAKKYGLLPFIPPSVRRADERIAQAEMRDLLPSLKTCLGVLIEKCVEPQPDVHTVPEIKPWPWYYAKEMWMARYYELGGKPE